jgi:predicted dehydrogenase
MWAPKVCPTEALKIESEYFIDCILNDKTPINDGQAGLRIVKILEAADKSMKKREELVYL